ncbi:hypothetical protein B0H19DRAFT_1058624 [Mycena capillaripes]|nr:hypothetical protein B0H19DRAFT_1058624 [Mycena capillaripes]
MYTISKNWANRGSIGKRLRIELWAAVLVKTCQKKKNGTAPVVPQRAVMRGVSGAIGHAKQIRPACEPEDLHGQNKLQFLEQRKKWPLKLKKKDYGIWLQKAQSYKERREVMQSWESKHKKIISSKTNPSKLYFTDPAITQIGIRAELLCRAVGASIEQRNITIWSYGFRQTERLNFIKRTEGGIDKIKICNMFEIKVWHMKIDLDNCWTGTAKGSFDMKVVRLPSAHLDGKHFRESRDKGGKIWN